ncbi:hypothetical protein OG943_16590 [Amycolatopsis sp. NBC_00345]|uniref:hypothetical protein n=1 Tax=Amycolatopsis sp. NBC_00345 TaxID=2975955 RepID=UPI002E25E0A7
MSRTMGENAPELTSSLLADAAGTAFSVRFSKYTSFGNNFIIVDETVTPLDSDEERAAFARWVLDGAFGVGGTDNVLYLRQAPGKDAAEQRVLRAQTAGKSDLPEVDFVFRIFEQDGSETLSCGNGLLSTAALLHRTYGGSRWCVLTELPTGDPQLVRMGVDDDAAGTTWINVGSPRAVPAELFNREGPVTASLIDSVDDLVVPLPADAPWAKGLPSTITLSGSLVFTGEPHLALVSAHGLPEVLEDRLFLTSDGENDSVGRPLSAARQDSADLVDYFGKYVNANYSDRFPQGVHLNFAVIRDKAGLVEYRTYERAIDKETLACGSGVIALAYILETLGLVTAGATEFWPHRCRWYQPDAALVVTETDAGWVLKGRPRLVCVGAVPRSPQAGGKQARHG